MIANKRGYSELSTQKGGVFFTTSDLRDLSKQFTDTNEQYQKMQSSLVKEVIAIAGGSAPGLFILCAHVDMIFEATYIPVLEDLDNIIAHLDVIIRCKI